jgi:hypothetical protein
LEEKIKARLLELHKESHDLVHNRPDLSVPLNFDQARRFDLINKEYKVLEIELEQLRKAAKISKEEKEQEQELLKLTDKEQVVLQIFVDKLPNPVLVKTLVSLSGFKRNRIYEHTRKFLFTGIIGHNSRGDGYYLTSKGRQYIKQHLSEKLRCDGVST